MSCAVPHSTEPTRKITMASRNSVLRPVKSPSLPHMGVVTVDASMYAVTTQEMCSEPPSSLTIVGKAVETIV
jgi:hypothetical protein